MPTSWKRADENALRAHLQEALAERQAMGAARDWSYSDYEIAAIREELNERQVMAAALRRSVASLGLAASAPSNEASDSTSPGPACCTRELPELPSPDRASPLRVLIARCFTPARHREGLGDGRELQGGPRPTFGVGRADRASAGGPRARLRRSLEM